MLENWLQLSKDTSSRYSFKLIHVTESNKPDDNLKNFLAAKILNAYRDIEFLKFQYQAEPKDKLIKYLQDNVIPSNTSTLSRNVWQGDVGEVLASLIFSHFFPLEVPLLKLRWKLNKDKSTFCTDMLAHKKRGKIKEIYYYEIKTRSTIRKERINGNLNFITVNAHNSLLRDKNLPIEAFADHLSRYYWEHQQFAKAKKYHDIVKNPNNYRKLFEVVCIIEQSKYITDILDDLHNLPPALSPLCVTIVLINEMDKLVTDMRPMVIDSAVSNMNIPK